MLVTNARGPHRGRELGDVLVAAVQRTRRQLCVTRDGAHGETVHANRGDLDCSRVEE